MENEFFEENFKAFLDEVCDKYNDTIKSENPNTRWKMEQEIKDYIYNNTAMVNSMTLDQLQSIVKYAINLESQFKDPQIGRFFWHFALCSNLQSLPKDK